jgi:hypothetical protein
MIGTNAAGGPHLTTRGGAEGEGPRSGDTLCDLPHGGPPRRLATVGDDPGGKAPDMLDLLIICVSLGVLAALVLLFVAFPYRGRSLPGAERLGDGVAAVADKIDPGEAPPQGVLGSPEAARRTRRRIEHAESRLTRRLQGLSHAVTRGDRHAAAGRDPRAATGGDRPAATGDDRRLAGGDDRLDVSGDDRRVAAVGGRRSSLVAGPRHSRR